MKIGVVLVLTLSTVVAGCGSQTMAARPATTIVDRDEPYRLYTHCGIQWARIDGTFWRAWQPLSDGNGNPPTGWGNPFQEGTLIFRSRTTARFISPAGSVTFKRTQRTRPPILCSWQAQSIHTTATEALPVAQPESA
jgi:hypothetical protein